MNSRKICFAILSLAALLILGACNDSGNTNENAVKSTKRVEKVIDSLYGGWTEGGGEKMKFRYPPDWVVKTKNDHGIKRYGLTPKMAEDLKDFFILEIYEFNTMNAPFKEFKFSAGQFIAQRFPNATIRNTEDIKFKGVDCRKYEADMKAKNDLQEFEVYAIDGSSRYYGLFHFKNDKTAEIVHHIMNSMIFYK